MVDEYVEDNYYAMFDTHSYHCFREIHFNTRLNVNNARLNVKSWQSHSSMKCRSRAPVHSVSLKSMSRTITMQGLTLTTIIVSEKYTLMFDSTWIILVKVQSWQRHSSMKSRPRAPVHSVCLKSMSRTIIIQGLILPAITASEKCTFMLDWT